MWLVQFLDLMNPTSRALNSTIIKITIWIVPVIIMIKLIEKQDPLTYLRLRPSRKGLKWIGVVFIILVIYSIINLSLLKNTFDFHLELHDWLNIVIMAGLTEEIVFRGFILRKLMCSYRFWLANIITAFLFLSIHFPIWFYKDLFQFPSILTTMITIFLLGLLFGWIYKRSDSLWPSIILHAMYNLLVIVLY